MVGGSLRVLRLPSTTKSGRHDIAESGVKHKTNQIKSTFDDNEYWERKQ